MKVQFTKSDLFDGMLIKKWQSNNYYPIKKINIVENGFIVSRQKIYNGELIYMAWSDNAETLEQILYRLNHNSYIITNNENSNFYN